MGEDGAGGLGGASLNDGEVALVGGSIGELLDEGTVGGVGFGDDEAARGVLVEPVDDPRAFDAADPGELAFAMMEQGVDESAVGVSGSGVDDHAFVLVDDDERVVFVKHPECDVLGLSVGRDRFGNFDLDAVADRDRVAGFRRLIVFSDVLLADEFLDARGGKLGESRRQPGIESGAGIIFHEDFHLAQRFAGGRSRGNAGTEGIA